MGNRYTVFIDESGEAGIERVRSAQTKGASPYMTLGAALIDNKSRASVEAALATIRADLKKDALHCSELKHYQLLHFVRQIVRQRVRFFGMISRKDTLGIYKAKISSDSRKYYNKCAQLLLERVGYFMEVRQIPSDHLDIVFERANFDYNKMRNLILKCQLNPHHTNTARLQNIHVGNISTKEKSEEPLLEMADLIAHALYKCVEKQDRYFHITEPRYLRELGPRFFGHPETQSVVDGGLYCVHDLTALKLDPDVEMLMANLRAE